MTSNLQIWMLSVVFLAQIIVMSFIAPARISNAYHVLREHFPREQYPKLYPLSADEMERWHRTRRWLHLSIGCAGLISLAAMLLTAQGLRKFVLLVMIFSMIQLVPTLVYAAWTRRMVREAAKMAPPAKRWASLNTTRITHYVSPQLIALGLILTTGTLATAVYLYFLAPRAVAIYGISAIASFVLLVRMLQKVLLPLAFSRPDPYMSQQDLVRVRQRQLRVQFVGTPLFCGYLIFSMLYAARIISFDFVYIVMGISIVFQGMALWFGTQLVRTFTSTDFSVYHEPNALPTEDRPSAV